MLMNYDFNIIYQSTNTICQADAVPELIRVQHTGLEDKIIAFIAVYSEIRCAVADAIRNTPVAQDELKEGAIRDPAL